MRKQPLILSPSYDINASAVCWGLEHSGLHPVWPQSGSFADDVIGTVSVSCDMDEPWQTHDGLSRARFSSVWHRWPRERSRFPGVHPGDLAFIGTEWRMFQRNILSLHDVLFDACWINPPASAQRAECKLVQLREASACGLRIPATLVSNDPARIRRFVAERSRTIYKPFRVHGWKNAESGAIFHTPATLVEDSTILKDAALALCPGIYQAYVDKTCDLRITVIGERIFAIRIDDGTGRALVDWRPAVNTSVDARTCSLPAALEARIRALMARLDLAYGAIDMVVDRDGEAWFLEVNQVGQFVFVEEWVDSLPLLQALCAMLAEGRPDYGLDSYAGVDLRGYKASDAYAHWHEQVWQPHVEERKRAGGFSEDA